MRRKCFYCFCIALMLLLALSAVVAGPVLGEGGKKAALHVELEDMLIIGSTGISIDFLAANRAAASAPINQALAEAGDNMFVNIPGQFINIFTRKPAVETE